MAQPTIIVMDGDTLAILVEKIEEGFTAILAKLEEMDNRLAVVEVADSHKLAMNDPAARKAAATAALAAVLTRPATSKPGQGRKVDA